MVDSYGRSFEFGLATRYHLTHSPLKKVGAGPLALEMISKDRMALRPHRIKAMSQLRAILDAAKAQEAV
jgi:heterodisulfide reductase subunit C/quinone-modifying oxidoreductase subunit QmoC